MATEMVDITTATTTNTMSIDNVIGRRRSVSRLLMSAAMLFVGLSLISLAVPRIVAYGILVSVEPRISPALKRGEMLPSDLLDRSIPAYVQAATWLPGDADIQQTLARLYLRRAADAHMKSVARQAALNSALARIDLALSAAPNRHFSWALQADILRLLNSPFYKIEEALRMSSLIGPYEASSMLLRSEIVLDLWNVLSPETRKIGVADLRRIWRSQKLHPNLAHLYLRQSLVERIRMRQILLHSQVETEKFNKLIDWFARQ